jgi:hypothetical protein
MLLTAPLPIFWHLLLPVTVVVQLATDGFPQTWQALVPRFLLFTLLIAKERGMTQAGRVLLAYLIESLALSLVGWLFGRAIM